MNYMIINLFIKNYVNNICESTGPVKCICDECTYNIIVEFKNLGIL